MKIPELAGLVMRREGYAHGDSTLQDDIIFMGSQLEHSAPLLRGLGVFACKASRKAASARYLSARASPLLRLLFPPRDVPALERDPVSGHVSCFPGTLCTTLLDSVAGLSRGFKCSLPKYHPRDILYLQWLTLQEVLREEGVGGQEEVGWELGDVCEELRGYAPRGAQPWYRDCQGLAFFLHDRRENVTCVRKKKEGNKKRRKRREKGRRERKCKQQKKRRKRERKEGTRP